MHNYRDLTNGSIRSHLLALAVPAAMGMIFTTLYNLTDYWFAGKVSDYALAGVSIAGTVFFLIIAGSVGMRTGTSAVIATEIGAGNHKINDWIDNATGLGLVVALLCLFFGQWLADPMVSFLGADSDVKPYALQYVRIVLFGCFGFVMMSVAGGALMALGDTVSNRNALAAGFVANIILNAIFIFTLNLGVRGLAISTVLIQLASAFYLYWIIRRRAGAWPMPRFDIDKWRALMRQVLPASFNMMMIVLGGFITVAFIGRFGSEHVAGYSVGLRIEQMLLLPALGLNTAVMAIVGQNFGANQPNRMIETYKQALLTGLVITLVAVPVMLFLSPLLLSFFSQSDTVIDTGTWYLRIDALAFFAYVTLFVGVATLQAMKRPLFPMYLGIARHLILPTFINYVLIVVFDFPMIYLFISVIVIVCCSAIVCHIYTWKKLTAALQETDQDAIRST